MRAELQGYQRELLRYVPDWLRHRGLRQKHIANALGITEGVVSRYFSGETLMPVGTLRKIAVLVQAHEGDLLRPPQDAGLGRQVEATLSEMDRLGPDRWEKVLAAAREMKGKSDA